MGLMTIVLYNQLLFVEVRCSTVRAHGWSSKQASKGHPSIHRTSIHRNIHPLPRLELLTGITVSIYLPYFLYWGFFPVGLRRLAGTLEPISLNKLSYTVYLPSTQTLPDWGGGGLLRPRTVYGVRSSPTHPYRYLWTRLPLPGS